MRWSRCASSYDRRARTRLLPLLISNRAALRRDLVAARFRRNELLKVMALPDVRERLIAIGMVPETSTPRELATNIRAEVARWGPIVKAAGVAQQ